MSSLNIEFESAGSNDCSGLRLYSKKTWCMGPWIVSYPPPLQRERGGEGKISPIGWAHLYLSVNFKNRFFYVNTSTEKGKGRCEQLILWLWKDISWSMGNPMPELTLIPRPSWLNIHKMTMNLDSGEEKGDPTTFFNSWLMFKKLIWRHLRFIFLLGSFLFWFFNST